MSYFKLSEQHSYTLSSMPRGRQSSVPINHSCNIPYKALVVDYQSNCLICSCDAWLPIPVGKIQDFTSIPEVFNSPTAKLLQKNVDDKKFTWCAVEHCGIKKKNNIQSSFSLAINIDESCNLRCPSCRREQIMHTQGPEFESKVQDMQRILQWLDQFNEPITIKLSGNGDPLASHIIRPMFTNFIPKPNHKILVRTNGLLIRKQLSKSTLMNNIVEFSISVDAGCAATYEKVRRGGKWEVLLDNLDFLVESQKASITVLNFCVQNSNYKDIPEFVELCKKYKFKGVIHQLDDWGTWIRGINANPDQWTVSNGTFEQHNVLDSSHENYNECKKIITELKNQSIVKLTPGLLYLLGS